MWVIGRLLEKLDYYGWALLIVCLDQLSKIWVHDHLAYLTAYPVLPHFNLFFVYNTGAAFGFLHQAGNWHRYFFCALSVVMSGVLATWLACSSNRDRCLNIGLALTLGGAIGNLIDRVHTGLVIDFLDFYWGPHHFAVFNLADAAISIGGALIAIDYLFCQKATS